MSVSRMMRNRCAPSTSVPGNSSWMLRSITSSRNANVSPRPAADRFGQRDEPRQHVRHLDARELGAPAVLHHHREVLAQVRDVGERVSRVERERRQDGEDLGLEVVREVARRSPACSRAARGSGCLPPPAAAAATATSRWRLRPSSPARAGGWPSSCCSVFRPSGEMSSMPARYFFRIVATRTMKNSSRFDAVMPRNFTRSSSG